MPLATRKKRFLAYRKKALDIFGLALKPELCGTCRFFFHDVAEPPKGWGRCRKRAPEPRMEVVIDLSILFPAVWWPEVYFEFWCGEFRRKRWWHRRNKPSHLDHAPQPQAGRGTPS